MTRLLDFCKLAGQKVGRQVTMKSAFCLHVQLVSLIWVVAGSKVDDTSIYPDAGKVCAATSSVNSSWQFSFSRNDLVAVYGRCNYSQVNESVVTPIVVDVVNDNTSGSSEQLFSDKSVEVHSLPFDSYFDVVVFSIPPASNLVEFAGTEQPALSGVGVVGNAVSKVFECSHVNLLHRNSGNASENLS